MRSIIVTGGSRGLGLGITRVLTRAGYHVIVIARQKSEDLTAAMRAVDRGQQASIYFEPFDLQNISDLPDLVKRLRKQFGSIYGLVNNAGIGTLSPLILTKCVVRSMMVDRGGRIVNVASIVGFTGYRGLSVYAATKASIIGFTRSLARELGPLGINVNAVAPGFIVTDMTQSLGGQKRDQIIRRSALGRLAEVEDVANAVAYLFDDKAKNITGTVLTVDAGNTA
jgi:3-oxoacyl-[acyl-carrier protein] reductase